MKAIKKVEVVPLDVNYGKIIDSFNTTDDKTKNAPSLNAVENYVTQTISDKIVVLTGTASISGTMSTQVSVDYPDGFTKDNCIVIGRMTNNVGTSNSSIGYVTGGAVNPIVSLAANSINIRYSFGEATTGTYDYKIALMKVD